MIERMATDASTLVLLILIATQLLGARSYNISNWTLSDQSFWEDDQNSIVGFDDITRNIWILGGYFNRHKIYTFNVDNQLLTDVTYIYNRYENISFSSSFHLSANAIIINHTIYSSSQRWFYSFNMETFQYTIHSAKYSYCMVTNTEKTKLYLAAAYHDTYLYVYDVLTGELITGPHLAVKHTGCGCHVVDNILYVVSGEATSTIEYIDLEAVNQDITHAEWHTLSVQLPSPLYAFSSALCGHLIFIIGGIKHRGTINKAETDTIYIFDTKTNELFNAPSFPFIIAQTTAICVESRIYLFKGWFAGRIKNSIWFADVSVVTDERTTTTMSYTRSPFESESTKTDIVPSETASTKTRNDRYYQVVFIVFGCVFCLVVVAFECHKRYKNGKIQPLEQSFEDVVDIKEPGNDDAPISDVNEVGEADEEEVNDANLSNSPPEGDCEIVVVDKADDSEEKEHSIEKMYERIQDETVEDIIIKWLKNMHLEQYLQSFLENGYDSLDYISEITDINQLDDIGIHLKGHRTKIMAAIKRLQNEGKTIGNSDDEYCVNIDDIYVKEEANKVSIKREKDAIRTKVGGTLTKALKKAKKVTCDYFHND